MPFPKADSETKPAPTEKAEFKCPECKESLEHIYSKKKTKYYWHCPDCETWYSEKSGKPVFERIEHGEPDENVKCPTCQAPMRKLTGVRTGDFYSCSKYPECKGAIDIAEDGSLAPLCTKDPEHGRMRKLKGRNGVFWSCRKYPDCTLTINIARANA